MRVTEIINKLSTARMEFQTLNGSVYHSFVVPFFIDKLDLRKVSKSIALAGSRGSGKSTYIQYFSHATRFDKNIDKVVDEEFDCIILYWKPDIAYCQGLKKGWLGDDALRFFNLHAALSLLKEFSRLINNIDYHFKDLVSELERNKSFWNNLSKVTLNQLDSTSALDQWLMDYEYHISTRLNPLNSEGLLSIEPKYMLKYLTDALRKDYKKFERTSFKVFVDLHTCEIVGWAMDERMTKTLICDALRAAYWRKKPSAGLMHHSDRGSQYCSKAYRALQTSYKMQTSMSNKGDCWDNAPMESFFGTLKTECLHHYKFKTRNEAKRVTFEYIEVFYNQIRRHAKLNNQAPAQFAKTYHQNLKENAA